jgi:transcriptional regulator with XRE-family HTH domain
MKIETIIGKNIKRFRSFKSLTQSELSDKINISESYLSLLEQGKKSPSLKLLSKIADELKIDIAILMTNEENLSTTHKLLI